MPPPHITYAHIILHGIASVVNSTLYPPLLPYKYKDVTVQIAQKLEGVVSLARVHSSRRRVCDSESQKIRVSLLAISHFPRMARPQFQPLSEAYAKRLVEYGKFLDCGGYGIQSTILRARR